jgi:hypothetical protein
MFHKWIRSYIIQIMYLESYFLQSTKKNSLSYKFTALVMTYGDTHFHI